MHVVNPLDDVFDRKRVDINIFASPFVDAVEDKTFTNCEFFGPAVITFHNCSVGSIFRWCDFVKMPPGPVQAQNILIFKDCTFNNCKFIRITLLIQGEMVEPFEQSVDNIRWLN